MDPDPGGPKLCGSGGSGSATLVFPQQAFLILTDQIIIKRFGGDIHSFYQCCGSMTFWGGSGSGPSNPCLWLMDSDPDPDPDPAVFVIDFEDASKKLFFKYNFFCLLLFEAKFTLFFKDKKSKRVTKCRNQGFSLLFLHDDRRIRIRIHTSD